MPEPAPDLVSLLDQAGAELEGQARVLGQYRRALESEGFERTEVMEIVHRWLDLQEPSEDSDE
jgi:hypothetical protein